MKSAQAGGKLCPSRVAHFQGHCYGIRTALHSTELRRNGEPTGLRNPTALPQGRARGSPFLHLVPYDACHGNSVSSYWIKIYRSSRNSIDAHWRKCATRLECKGIYFSLFPICALPTILVEAESAVVPTAAPNGDWGEC